jgi:hypothetical protein
MGWFKKITKGISKAVKDVGNFADDALGFDPNGGGFTDVYNIAGMATVGVPVGSIGSAGVNLSRGDVKGALQQGLNGGMAYGAGQLGGGSGQFGDILGGLGGSGNSMGMLSNILGGGMLGGGGGATNMNGLSGILSGGMGGQSPNVNINQSSPISKMPILNNQSPLTSRPRKELTEMLLSNLISKQGGVNGFNV